MELKKASLVTLERLAAKLGESTVRAVFPELVQACEQANEDAPYNGSRIGFLAPIGRKA